MRSKAEQPRHRGSLPLLLGVLAMLAACSAPTVAQPGRTPGAPSGAAGSISVYKALGSRQCETPPPRAAIERELAAAGVPVLSTACGSDGRMRTAMCGAPDGRIVIFEVPPGRAAAAAAAGFEPLADLPDATRQPCPGS